MALQCQTALLKDPALSTLGVSSCHPPCLPQAAHRAIHSSGVLTCCLCSFLCNCRCSASPYHRHNYVNSAFSSSRECTMRIATEMYRCPVIASEGSCYYGGCDVLVLQTRSMLIHVARRMQCQGLMLTGSKELVSRGVQQEVRAGHLYVSLPVCLSAPLLHLHSLALTLCTLRPQPFSLLQVTIKSRLLMQHARIAAVG